MPNLRSCCPEVHVFAIVRSTTVNVTTQTCRKDFRSGEKFTGKRVGDTNAKKQTLKGCGDDFEGIGCFGGAFHITVDPTVPPIAPQWYPGQDDCLSLFRNH